MTEPGETKEAVGETPEVPESTEATPAATEASPEAVSEPAIVASEDAPAPIEEPDLVCPSCGASGEPGSRFCEVCGALMSGVPEAVSEPAIVASEGAPLGRPCAACGGAVAADGYCTECGARALSERDHFEITASPTLGGVCDKGIVHHRNEDAMSLAVAGDIDVLVVCDGVSSSPDSDVASMAATQAAVAVLSAGAPGGGREVTQLGASRTSAWASLLVEAAKRANEAVVAVESSKAGDAPSCTYAAAIAEGDRIVMASVGDSRAYWLPDGGPATRLATDDSWAQEMIDQGMPEAQVNKAPQAHAITRWLGADAPPIEPRTDTVTVVGPGWLLLCSDGLWNYCSEAEDLATLVRTTQADLTKEAAPSPTQISGALVQWANAQGGRDNITAALARLGEHEPAPAASDND